jgi:signal transduction histidine kinase
VRRIASASRSAGGLLVERDARIDGRRVRECLEAEQPIAWSGPDGQSAPWDSGVVGPFGSAAIFRLGTLLPADRPPRARTAGSAFALAIWADSAAAALVSEGRDLARRAGPAVDRAREHAELARGLEENDRLLAQLRHETGNAITAIRIATSLLGGPSADPTRDSTREGTDSIRTALDDIEARLDDIGVWYRSRPGPARPRKENHVLADLLARAVTRVEPLLGARGLRIQVDLEQDGKVNVDVEPTVRALARLLLNAAGRVRDRGGIHVIARQAAHETTVSIVGDSGSHARDSIAGDPPGVLLVDAFGVRWPADPSPDLTLALILAHRCGLEIRSRAVGDADSAVRVSFPDVG